MNKKISVNLAIAIAIIAMTVTFSITMILSQNIFDKTVSSVREKEQMYDKIAEIDKNVRAEYYGAIDDNTLFDMTSTGYMNGIGDKNARYYTANSYLEYLNEQSGKILGVGVDVVKNSDGYARIIRVYADSPASEAGLEKNGYITKIGAQDTKELTIAQINSAMRGEAGTTVDVTWVTQLAEERGTVTLQRRQYDTPSVEWSVVDGKTTGYIKIRTFNTNTAAEITQAVQDILAQRSDISSLVFDVRDNTGGSLTAAIAAVDAVCPAGSIAVTMNKNEEKTVLGTSDVKEIAMPMAVLVNGSTAAGAELFATSIRDFGKGKVVGVTTAGKGTIQCTPVRLSDGSAISYTTGILLTKTEESFDGVGVSPDVIVEAKADELKNPYDLTIQNDSQIVKAFEVAASQAGQTATVVAAVSESAPEATSESAASTAE